MYSFGKQLAALPRSQYGPWAVIAAGDTDTATAFARHIAANGINIVLAAHGGRADAYTLTMTAGVSVRTTSPDVFNGELAAATDDIEVGLLVCITDEDAGGSRFGESDLNRLRTLYLTHRFGQRIASRGEGAVIMVKSLAAQSISNSSLTGNADSAFTTGYISRASRWSCWTTLFHTAPPWMPTISPSWPLPGSGAGATATVPTKMK